MTAGSRIAIVLGAVALLLLIPAGSASAAAIIQEFEGFETVPYWDANGWAVGYGSHYNYDAGRAVRQSDVITAQTALKWLNIRINEDARFLDDVVNVPLSTNQRDSLLSLIYNIGRGAFSDSTLLQKINARRPAADIADQFDRWKYSDGVVDPDLVARRRKEKQLFLS